MSTVGPLGQPEPPREDQGRVLPMSAKGAQLPSQGPALKTSFLEGLRYRIVTFFKATFGNQKKKKTAIDQLAVSYIMQLPGERKIHASATFDRIARPFLIEYADLATIQDPERMAPFLELITLYSQNSQTKKDESLIQQSVKKHLLASLKVPKANAEALGKMLDLVGEFPASASLDTKLTFVEGCIETATTATPMQMKDILEKVEKYFAQLQQAKEELHDVTDKSLILDTIKELRELIPSNTLNEKMTSCLRPLLTTWIKKGSLSKISTPTKADQLELALGLSPRFLKCVSPLGGKETESLTLYNNTWERLAKELSGEKWPRFKELVDDFEKLLAFVDREDGPQNEEMFASLFKKLEDYPTLDALIVPLIVIEQKRPVPLIAAQLEFSLNLMPRFLECVAPLGMDETVILDLYSTTWRELAKKFSTSQQEDFQKLVDNFETLLMFVGREEKSQDKEMFAFLVEKLNGYPDLNPLIVLLAIVEEARPLPSLQATTGERPLKSKPKTQNTLFLEALATIHDVGDLSDERPGVAFTRAWEQLNHRLPLGEFELVIIRFKYLLQIAKEADPSDEELFKIQAEHFKHHMSILEKYSELTPFMKNVYENKFGESQE